LTRFHALTARLSGRRSPAERLVGSQRLEFFPGAALEPDRIAHEYLSCMCFIDYLHELALVALHTNAMGEPKIVAAGQLLMERNRNEAEVAVLISDEFQHRGIGTELLRRLVEVGRSEHIARMVGYILSNNSAMLHACKRLGFHHEHEFGDPMDHRPSIVRRRVGFLGLRAMLMS
jgi:GNAT superfamily N-acetyltransferase